MKTFRNISVQMQVIPHITHSYLQDLLLLILRHVTYAASVVQNATEIVIQDTRWGNFLSRRGRGWFSSDSLLYIPFCIQKDRFLELGIGLSYYKKINIYASGVRFMLSHTQLI